MAAFSNSNIITASQLPRLHGGYQYIIVRGSDYSGYYDNGRRYWPDTSHLDALIKDFKREAEKIVELDNFAHRPRERVVGRDYKTPSGTRPYWFRPEASSVDPPTGVSLPRWREYQRRRGT